MVIVLKTAGRKVVAWVVNRLIRMMGNRSFPALDFEEWKSVGLHFSQCGEDVVLEKIWTEKFGSDPGFYVDVGAFHPITYSNTHLLYRKGWRGKGNGDVSGDWRIDMRVLKE